MLAVQGAASVLVGTYYAGLLGLASPDLAVVSYALVGLLVLFQVRLGAVTDVEHTHPYVVAAALLLWATWALQHFRPVQPRKLSNLLGECAIDDGMCQALEGMLGTADPQHWTPPHADDRKGALTVLAVALTIILTSYPVVTRTGTTPVVPPAAVPWMALPVSAWAIWVCWALARLSSNDIVRKAKTDTIFPALDGGPSLVEVTPVVARLQLYALFGPVVALLLVLMPNCPPLVGYLYLFMGLYFLGNLYKINRLLAAWAQLDNERPEVPPYAQGFGVLAAAVGLALIILLWQTKLAWPQAGISLLVLAAMGFAVWDTHAVEKLNDDVV